MPKPSILQLPLPFADETFELTLLRGQVGTISAIDADLTLLHWWTVKSKYTHYVVRKKPRKEGQHAIFIHRVILERVLGRELLDTEKVDHIDCDGLNNCRDNLRLATFSQNSANGRKRQTNTTGYKGVCFSKNAGKFLASITVGGSQMFLGYFDTSEKAHKAYCDAAVKYFGEFARFD